MRYVLRIILILLACVFVYTSSTHAQEKYNWEYIYTIDGDSILFQADWVPLPTKRKVIIVRLDGVDTPERHSLCKEERNKAEKAKAFVQEAMKAKEILVQPKSWDKFGGRILARVFSDGRDLSELLIAEGLAREYHGEKKKSWC